MAAIAKQANGEWLAVGDRRAVTMLRHSAIRADGMTHFDFAPTMVSPTVRIEWASVVGGAQSMIALLPAAVAVGIINKGYARDPSDGEAAGWNAAFQAAPPAKVETDAPKPSTVETDAPKPSTVSAPDATKPAPAKPKK